MRGVGSLLSEVRITGTLIWYYVVCPRETWLMSRQLTPDEDDDNIRIGRIVHEYSYPRVRKEVSFSGGTLDFVRSQDGSLVISEVKKSSRHEASARMQLLFYLYELRREGVNARGELHFPEERRVREVELGETEGQEVEQTIRAVEAVVRQSAPPPPKRIPVCRTCAYAEFCWS